MKIQKQPDYLIFADSAKKGENTEFPDISRGWGITIEQTASKPPMEWMNGAFSRIDKNMLYLLQQGVPEWSEKVTYPVNAIIKYNGVLYTAIVENDNAKPSINTTKWKKTQAETPYASNTQYGIVKLNSATNNPSETEAATPLAVKNTNNRITDVHNIVININDKFNTNSIESRVYSHDKRFYLIVRDDGTVGMYNAVTNSLMWGFDANGALGVGKIGTANIYDLEQFVYDKIPVGVPLPWPTITPPDGWAVCNGWRFDTTKNPRLARAYPSGVLPDLRGEFIRGLDCGRGADPNRGILSWQPDAIRNFTGSFAFESNIGGNSGGAIIDGVFYPVPDSTRSHLASSTGGTNSIVKMDVSRGTPTSHDIHPRNLAFMYIVKLA